MSATRNPSAGTKGIGRSVGRGDGTGGAALAAIQRGRMISAMFEVCSKYGASNLTVAHVVATAGTSRRTFYEIFVDCEDCLLTGFEEAVARASRRVLPAYRAHKRWQDKIRASLEALLLFFDSDPHVGRFLVVETPAAGTAALERRTLLLERIVSEIARDAPNTNAGVAQSPIAAEGTVGAVLAVIHARMLTSQADPNDGHGTPAASLIELLNPLMSIAVLPYLGPAAARRELERPVSLPAQIAAPTRRQLAGLGIRITFRTTQVMAVIAERPGRSNREIGDAAGIGDPGQISKLLARLKRVELIENMADHDSYGAPNAWQLTQAGRDVYAAISG